MKILITSTGKTIKDEIDPRFGRCNYFLVVKIEENKKTTIKAAINKGKNESHGAGLIAAEQVGNLMPDAIITGNLGPNAFLVLNQIRVKTYTTSGGIEKAIENFLKNKLKEITIPSQAHPGSGQIEQRQEQKERKTRLAICTDGTEISPHFGRSPDFIIADIAGGKVIARETIKNPGHRTGVLPKYLNEKGVDCIIVGGAGPMAVNFFKEYGIEIILGITGDVDNAIDEFAKGKLTSKNSLCNPRTAKGYGVDKEDSH